MREAIAIKRLAAHGIKRIPSGWLLSKVKYLADYINGYAFKPNDWSSTGKPIIRIQDLSNLDSNPNRYEGTLDSCYEVRAGDFLISWSATLGLFVWQGENAWLNQHIFKVVLNEKLLRREYYSWLATWFMEELSRDTHGSTMQHLTKDAFGSFPVVLPPFETQTQISNYLDRKTAELDQLIGSKQRLLKLLDEKDRTLTARAVTRGLDPDVPFKDSGIPWLSMIPAHWEIERARWLFVQSDLPVREEDEMVTCFRDGMVTLRSNRREAGFTNAILELGYQGIRKGQLVLHSMDAFAGAIGVSDSDGKCTPEYVICDPITNKTDSNYYGLLLREMALQNYIQAQCSAVRERAPRIRFNQFKDFELPVPPIEEQKLIVAHIKYAMQSIKQLKEITEKAIILLQERRTALISAAVTGKISRKVLNTGIETQTREHMPNQEGEHHPCLT